jgi:hypothetical protein
MSQLGLEHTVPVFERAKKVHALDRVATVFGKESYRLCKNITKLEKRPGPNKGL